MSDTSGGNRAKALFLEALERPAEGRAGFVEAAAGEDAELRARVLGLLAAHERAAARGAVSGATPRPGRLGLLAEELRPGARIGGYVLREELGRGGFGVVHLAEQEQPVRRRVALKVLGRGGGEVAARFQAERQALALMDHPGIARVLDAGETPGGRPFFVMELVEGPPITRYCEERRLGWRARLELFRAVALAVQHAHHKGVVHRDLKPSNVLVATVDGAAVPKVIDFGVAKALEEPLAPETLVTAQGHLLGTPAYMSPEQAAGEGDVDTRADVYSLGALLHELMCGGPPLELAGAALPAVLRRIQDAEPPRISARSGAGLKPPPELDWIALRCLEKERERRYPTAFALARDVQRLLDDEPLEAAPPSTWYRVRKLARRHRAATFGALAVVAALALGVVGTSRGLVAARRANAALDAALGEARADAERARRAERRAADEAVEARVQERIARAVNDFLNRDLLQAVLPGADPARGREVKMLEVLDAAGERIERAALPGGRFAEAPRVEAAIRETLGTTYAGLGRLEAAERHLRRALELARAERGAHDPGALRVASSLGDLLRQRGRYEEAAELLAPTFEAQRAALGAGAPETLGTQRRLGVLRWHQGRRDEAQALFEAGAAAARAELGEEHEETLALLGALASALSDLGRHEPARALREEVFEARRRLHGPDDPDALGAQVNLATSYLHEGRLELAEALLAEALEGQRRLFGAAHPETLVAMHDLALLHHRRGRLEEARALFEETLAVSSELRGAEHPGSLATLAQLARVEQDLGNGAAAEAMLREAVSISAEIQGALHVDTLAWKKSLGAVLLEQQRTAEAEALFRELAEEEARAFGADDPRALTTLHNVAIALQNAARYEEAESAMRRALEGLRARLGEAHPLALRVASDLSALYVLMDRPQEAERLARRCVELARAELPAESPETLRHLFRLGLALCEQGRYEEAEPLLLDTYARLRAALGVRHDWTDKCASGLVDVYAGWGRAEEAARWTRIRAGGEPGPSAR